VYFCELTLVVYIISSVCDHYVGGDVGDNNNSGSDGGESQKSMYKDSSSRQPSSRSISAMIITLIATVIGGVATRTLCDEVNRMMIIKVQQWNGDLNCSTEPEK
jgi:hypothetical protein